MTWNIGDNRTLFLEQKTKLGLCHVQLRNPKDSPEKITLFLVETQHLPDFEEADSKDGISCLKWSIYNGRRNVWNNFQTDTDKVSIVVYRHWNNTYLKDTEMELKLTEYEKLWFSAFTTRATLTFSLSAALYWMKQLFIFDSNFFANGRYHSCKQFPILFASKNTF